MAFGSLCSDFFFHRTVPAGQPSLLSKLHVADLSQLVEDGSYAASVAQCARIASNMESAATLELPVRPAAAIAGTLAVAPAARTATTDSLVSFRARGLSHALSQSR
jgi:hypothetical protein